MATELSVWPFALISSPKKLLAESLLIYSIVLLICKMAFHLRGYAKVIDYLFEPLVLILWVYVPTFILMSKRLNFEAYGITFGGIFDVPRRKILASIWQKWLKMTLITIVLVIPIFVVGYAIWSHLVLHRGIKVHFRAGWFSMVIGQLFVIGFPEEFFFRGFLQTHMNRIFRKPIRIKGWDLSFWGVKIGWGLILSSALFAIGHPFIEGNYQRLAVFFPSLLFGWIRDKTGTIASSSIIHAVCNITIFTLEGGY